MTPPLLGLRTAIYKVPNIASAKTWYATVLATDPYFDEPFYVGFNVGGFELGLQSDTGSAESKIDSVVAYWGVADVQEAYARVVVLGGSENEAPQEVGGGIVVATLKDPWNNVIGLIYNPHFRIADQ